MALSRADMPSRVHTLRMAYKKLTHMERDNRVRARSWGGPLCVRLFLFSLDSGSGRATPRGALPFARATDASAPEYHHIPPIGSPCA